MSRVTPELLEALVDDAGLFPPEQLSMDAALARHRADEAGGHLMLTQRFLCPASRLAEMRSLLTDGDRIRLGLILDTGLPGLQAALEEAASEPRLLLEAVEVSLPGARWRRPWRPWPVCPCRPTWRVPGMEAG